MIFDCYQFSREFFITANQHVNENSPLISDVTQFPWISPQVSVVVSYREKLFLSVDFFC